MKRIISAIITVVLALCLSFSLIGCAPSDNSNPSDNNNPSDNSKTIRVGASPTPHAEILTQIKDELKKDGWKLEIVEYDDYVIPNTALESGDLDANYFQHLPYLNNFNATRDTHIVKAEAIHYEPLTVFGNGVTKANFAAKKTGRTIFIPNDGSNETRALFLLQDEGYITLRADATADQTLTKSDITDNKGNNIVEVEASYTPAQLSNSDAGSLAVVNGNYALAANLNFANALATENAAGSAAVLYANIVAVKQGNENSAKTQALVKALKSQKVYDYILQQYNGAVLPSFTVAD